MLHGEIKYSIATSAKKAVTARLCREGIEFELRYIAEKENSQDFQDFSGFSGFRMQPKDFRMMQDEKNRWIV